MNNFIVIFEWFWYHFIKLSEICRRLEEGRLCGTLQWLLPTHVSIFATFFYVYTKVVKRVHNIAPDGIFHFSIIKSLKNTFPKHFKYSRVSNNRHPPAHPSPPIVILTIFCHPGHLYSNPLSIFSHFWSHFWV